MARLPQITADARLPADSGAAMADARYPLSTVGANVARLGEKGVDLAGTALVAQVHAQDQADATRAIAETTQKLDTLRQDLERDPNYLGREQKFNDAARQLETETTSALSPRAAAMFQERLAGLYQAQAHGVRTQARKDQTDELRVQLDENTNALLDAAVQAKNPIERQMKLDAVKAALTGARETGVISGAQEIALTKAKLEKFDEIQVSRYMRTNPSAAIRMLDDRAATPNLDPLRREQLKINAQVRLEQMSALAKADAHAEVSSVIDAFRRGNLQPANLDAAERKAASFPDLAKTLAGEKYVYNQAADFAAKDVPEQQRIITSMRESEQAGRATPTDTRLRDAYEHLSTSLARSFTADPMATAMQRNTAAADTYAAASRDYAAATTESARTEAQSRFQASLDELVTTQQKNGVPPHAIQLLPKASATAIEANVNQQTGQARVDLVQALKTQYAARWPLIYRQLNAGQKLPADVKILASAELSNADALSVQRAMTLTEKQRAEMVPAPTDRTAIRDTLAKEGQAAREALARVPDGGAAAYGDLANAAHQVADYLYGTKAAASPEEAARRAWGIVFNDHWSVAGSVAIRKENGVPLADPNLVRSFQDYWKQKLLPEFGLAVPPPTPGIAHLDDAQRVAMSRRTLGSSGYWVADGQDRGMVLLDGAGIPARDANGRAIAYTWREILSDQSFLNWQSGQWRQRETEGEKAAPSLLLPSAPPASRDRIEQTPAYRRRLEGR